MDPAQPRDPENGSGPEPPSGAPAEPGGPEGGNSAGDRKAAGDGEAGADGSGPEDAGAAGDGAVPAEPVRGAETAEQPPVGDNSAVPGTEPVDPWSGSAETIYGGVDPVPAGETGPTGTGILPPVPSGPPDPPETPDPSSPAETPENPRWSARAQVPTPGAGDADDDGRYWEGREQLPRSVMPALIALAIVLLLAIIGFGLWLALHNKDAPTTPATTPPAHATTQPATSSPTATTTTVPPTTAPPTTPPALIPVPDVSGLLVADAQAKLSQVGLTVGTQEPEASNDVPAGNVIRTDPQTGFPLPAGQAVNLVVSTGPAATATPTPPITPS